MMTDAEIRSMRDSVRGMNVDQAAALPIYDQFRGLSDDGGVPLERIRAFHDGAIMGQATMDAAAARSEAYRDHMIDRINNAYRAPVNDNRATAAVTRDGRRIADIADPVDQARQQMIADMAVARSSSEA